MKRMVLDLRGNGGGFLNAAIDLADEFLPDGRVIVYTEGRNSPRRDITASRRGQFESIPLAILIDEGSASASEIIAGAMQDNDRAVIVGRRSFGKGLVQEHVDLPDQSAVRLTTARYYTASGRSIQRPYGAGIDYGSDYNVRYEHGELLSADSIRQDSSQTFTTLKGRTVYGGGGVMPDIFVPADTSEGSNYLSELFYTGALNQFALDIADRDRIKLLDFGTYKAFNERFVVSEALLRELGAFAQKQGIEPNAEDLARSRSQIATRLKAGIARNVWGNAGFYEIMLDTDSIFKRASQELVQGA
jgi:carboxyl-terminal processing protease